MAEHDFAVVVGIGVYGAPHLGGLSPLTGPDPDAQEIFDWLTDVEGIAPARIAFLRSEHMFPHGPPPNLYPIRAWPCRRTVEEEIRQRIVDVIREQIDTRQAPKEGYGRLILYFAGHGACYHPTGNPLVDDGDAKLYSARADQTGNRTGRTQLIPLTQITQHFANARWFREVILVTDGCRDSHTADGHYPAWLDQTWLEPPPARHRPAQTYYAFAARAGAKTPERQIGGQQRGVFTYFFRHAIRFAPRNTGTLMSDTFSNYLSAALREYYGSDEWTPAFFPNPGEGPAVCVSASPAHPLEVEVFFTGTFPSRPDDTHGSSGRSAPQRVLVVQPEAPAAGTPVQLPVTGSRIDRCGPFRANLGIVYRCQFLEVHVPAPSAPPSGAAEADEPPVHLVREVRFTVRASPRPEEAVRSTALTASPSPVGSAPAGGGVRLVDAKGGVAHVRI